MNNDDILRIILTVFVSVLFAGGLFYLTWSLEKKSKEIKSKKTG